ncbi:hypothetical protein E2562_029191 [Oryza meyeriana var. granulata]|uniref:Uncharacterized protein n=1 Tax=Oryza meyeriana var. granulata TaxID=110450 RepID=A0A6G1E3G0_9ORYZ|nr:hypothetical protein E2562_029191 [Oryza meyeriana var. granulata]
MRSALATKEAYLQEGRHQLEAFVRATKAVYDRSIAEVEWERTALDAECVEVVTAREAAAKALRELQG